MTYGVTIVDADQASAGPICSIDDLAFELLADGLELAVVRHEGQVTAFIHRDCLCRATLADAAELAEYLESPHGMARLDGVDPHSLRCEPPPAHRRGVDVDPIHDRLHQTPPVLQVSRP